MTEQEFVRRVEALSVRMEVKPPRVRVSPARGKDALRIRIQGWTVRTTPRTLEELTDAEIEFGLALAMAARLEPGQRQPHWVAAPFATLTFIGVTILYFWRDSFLDQFWLGYAILFGLMLVGYVAGMFVAYFVEERARVRVIGEALNLTGNASAAQAYLIRCKTDYVMSGRRRLASSDRDQLAEQLQALARAAYGLGLSYTPVRFSD